MNFSQYTVSNWASGRADLIKCQKYADCTVRLKYMLLPFNSKQAKIIGDNKWIDKQTDMISLAPFPILAKTGRDLMEMSKCKALQYATLKVLQ